MKSSAVKVTDTSYGSIDLLILSALTPTDVAVIAKIGIIAKSEMSEKAFVLLIIIWFLL